MKMSLKFTACLIGFAFLSSCIGDDGENIVSAEQRLTQDTTDVPDNRISGQALSALIGTGEGEASAPVERVEVPAYQEPDWAKICGDNAGGADFDEDGLSDACEEDLRTQFQNDSSLPYAAIDPEFFNGQAVGGMYLDHESYQFKGLNFSLVRDMFYNPSSIRVEKDLQLLVNTDNETSLIRGDGSEAFPYTGNDRESYSRLADITGFAKVLTDPFYPQSLPVRPVVAVAEFYLTLPKGFSKAWYIGLSCTDECSS